MLIITIKRSYREKQLDAVDVRGLLSLLLADGSLVSYRTPGGGYIQLTLTAGASESAFLEEKVDEFRLFIPTKAEIVPYKTSPRANGKTTPTLRFRVSTNKLRPVYLESCRHFRRRGSAYVYVDRDAYRSYLHHQHRSS